MILIVFKCQNSSLDYYRHSQEVYREADGAVHHDQVIDECKKKQSDNTGYWSDEMKKEFVNAPHWSIEKWVAVLAKGGGQKKRFEYWLNSNYPHQFLHLRAIQGHLGSTINPALQDPVLLPEGFTEFFFLSRWKRKRIEVNREPRFDARRSHLRTGRQAVFFTIVNPMDNQDGKGETLCDLSQARIAPYKNTWKRFQNTVFWSNLKLTQQRGLQFYQTRSNAVIFYDTLPAEFIEKAICMKTKDQLFKGKA